MDGVSLFLRPIIVYDGRVIKRKLKFFLRNEIAEVSLSNPQGLLVCALLNSRSGLDIDDMIDIFWPNPDDLPEMFYYTAHSRLSQLNRQKLSPLNLSVKTAQHGWKGLYKIIRI